MVKTLLEINKQNHLSSQQTQLHFQNYKAAQYPKKGK